MAKVQQVRTSLRDSHAGASGFIPIRSSPFSPTKLAHAGFALSQQDEKIKHSLFFMPSTAV